MTTISAQLYGGGTVASVLVTVTGLAGVDRVNVWREPPAAPREPVAGGLDVIPTSDTLVLLDVVPELGRPLIYVVEESSGSSTVVETSAAPIVVPNPGRHVLSDPVTGSAVLVDVIATEDARTTDAGGAVLRPVGRRRPVILTGTRSDDQGELVAYTRDRAEAAALDELLDRVTTVASRHPFDGCDVPGLELLSIPIVTRARRTREGDRIFTLPFYVVDLPAIGTARQLVTLADLAAQYEPAGTLTDLSDDYATLLQVAQDDLGVVA